MRITAGTHRSRNLKTLDSDVTRPTSDKIRQAIFSRIGPYFDAASFLDVFGGTGAMALEAVSRGMGEAVCIEAYGPAQRIINENIKLLGEMSHVKLVKGDALIQLEKLNQKFDYIFIDPPYKYDYFEDIIRNAIKFCSHQHTLIIVESDATKELPEIIENFECVHSKKYGHSKLFYYEVIYED